MMCNQILLKNVLSTHLLCDVITDIIRHVHPNWILYARLRARPLERGGISARHRLHASTIS